MCTRGSRGCAPGKLCRSKACLIYKETMLSKKLHNRSCKLPLCLYTEHIFPLNHHHQPPPLHLHHHHQYPLPPATIQPPQQQLQCGNATSPAKWVERWGWTAMTTETCTVLMGWRWFGTSMDVPHRRDSDNASHHHCPCMQVSHLILSPLLCSHTNSSGHVANSNVATNNGCSIMTTDEKQGEQLRGE